MRPYLSAGNRTYGQSSYFSTNPSPNWVLQDVGSFFAPTFVSAQAMIEKVALPINLGVLHGMIGTPRRCVPAGCISAAMRIASAKLRPLPAAIG